MVYKLLQVHISADVTSYLIAGISSLAVVVATLFGILLKIIKEKSRASERHAETVQKIMETISKEAINAMNNNNYITQENIQQTKELRSAIQSLPNQLRDALK